MENERSIVRLVVKVDAAVKKNRRVILRENYLNYLNIKLNIAYNGHCTVVGLSLNKVWNLSKLNRQHVCLFLFAYF